MKFSTSQVSVQQLTAEMWMILYTKRIPQSFIFLILRETRHVASQSGLYTSIQVSTSAINGKETSQLRPGRNMQHQVCHACADSSAQHMAGSYPEQTILTALLSLDGIPENKQFKSYQVAASPNQYDLETNKD
jgi:hypothetical protein